MRGTIRLALAHSAAAANATAAAKATAQLQTMILNSRGAHVDASLHVRRQRMCLQVGIFLLCRFCERARVCVVVRALVLLNSVLCARTRSTYTRFWSPNNAKSRHTETHAYTQLCGPLEIKPIRTLRTGSIFYVLCVCVCCVACVALASTHPLAQQFHSTGWRACVGDKRPNNGSRLPGMRASAHNKRSKQLCFRKKHIATSPAPPPPLTSSTHTHTHTMLQRNAAAASGPPPRRPHKRRQQHLCTVPNALLPHSSGPRALTPAPTRTRSQARTHARTLR